MRSLASQPVPPGPFSVPRDPCIVTLCGSVGSGPDCTLKAAALWCPETPDLTVLTAAEPLQEQGPPAQGQAPPPRGLHPWGLPGSVPPTLCPGCYPSRPSPEPCSSLAPSSQSSGDDKAELSHTDPSSRRGEVSPLQPPLDPGGISHLQELLRDYPEEEPATRLQRLLLTSDCRRPHTIQGQHSSPSCGLCASQRLLAHPHPPFSMDPGSSPTVAHSCLPRPHGHVPAQQAQDGPAPTALLLAVRLAPRTVLSGQHVAISPSVRTSSSASKVRV